MIRAETQPDGRTVEVAGSGEAYDMVNELKILIPALRESLKGSCGTETAYAYMLMKMSGFLRYEYEAAMGQLEELQNTAEDGEIRKALESALGYIHDFDENPEKREGMIQDFLQKMYEMAEARADGQDPEKISEMEEALKARIERRDKRETDED